VACPFFLPQHRLENGSWPHPDRLPLGAGWRGCCTAPGSEGHEPELAVLEQACNLGYATACSRLPLQRPADSVRFQVTRTGERTLVLTYTCERDHRPAGHGNLEFDRLSAKWIIAHQNTCIQKMAACYLESYLLRSRTSSSTESETP
jgi:hypothetical protein